MKVRQGFVSNSSSSSFICIAPSPPKEEWRCDYCDTISDQDTKKCPNCGAFQVTLHGEAV